MFLALTLAALTTAGAPADGTYKYVSTMNGSEIARTTIVLKHTAQSLVLTESGAGSMNGQSGSVEDTLTLDERLAPASYIADASVADSRNMKSTLTFAGAQAKQGGDVTKTYELTGTSKHFVLMDVGPFSGFFMIPSQMRAWKNATVTAIVPNFGHSFVLAPDAALKPERPSGVPASDRSYSFSSMVQLTLWYDPRTLLVDEVDVPAQGLIVRRLP